MAFFIPHRWSATLVFAASLLSGCSRDATVRGFDPAKAIKAEETIAKTLEVGAAPSVTVSIFNGAIAITAGVPGSVQATITKRAFGATKDEAEEALKELTITFDQETDKLHIAAVPPRNKPFSGGAAARLEVPIGASLELKTSLDGIAVSDIDGRILAHNSQGSITITTCRGELNLTTSLGNIDVNSPSPEVRAKNSQGTILVRGATGTLDLSTSLGTIDVNAPCTGVMAKNSQGNVLVRGAAGALDLTTSLGQIHVEAPCTSVIAKNSQGPITVKGAAGPLKLTTSLGNIVVSASGAELEAINSQGTINAQGVKGRVKAKTSLGNLSIEASDAVIDAENSQGAVTFRGSLAAGQHAFRTSLANIDVTLPADARFHIDAQASLGRIASAFALKQQVKSGAARLVGTIGDNPDASVQVRTSQGNISLKKAP